ncbi:MAG: AAA family ATPase [Acidobacteriaceae bacterium]|nr:AAA family ATPase [Acidobacteriaceae bacterium]MBV9500926.1 AAA family ATPase [Acidobacteriaceae bacterium]
MQSAIYNAYFGFSENPFNISPDPEFLYRSSQYEEVLANLIYGVRSRKGFIVLTGEVGTGKTTMLECLRDFLDSMRYEFAFLFNSRLTPDQFFEMVGHDFDLPGNHKSKTEVLFALNELLLQQAERGRTCVLIVDEAHNLEWDVLEEIRLLGNLENRQGKLLQIVLAGQPELDQKLDTPNLRQLKQRIVLRCSLNPLTPDECAAYVETRLARAGRPRQNLFSPEVLEEIYKRSRGIPRVINLICDNLLVTTFAMEQRAATLEMLDEVSQDLRLQWPGSQRTRRGRSRYPDTEEEYPHIALGGD